MMDSNQLRAINCALQQRGSTGLELCRPTALAESQLHGGIRYSQFQPTPANTSHSSPASDRPLLFTHPRHDDT